MTSVQVQHHVNEDVTMGVKALVIALAVISVALRFYTRIFTCAGLKADDWLILSAVVATLLTAVLLLWGTIGHSFYRRTMFISLAASELAHILRR